MLAPINNLFQQEMDRKEFLKSAGAMLFFVAGGGMIVNALQSAFSHSTNNTSAASKSQKSTSTYGYGASVYGGR